MHHPNPRALLKPAMRGVLDRIARAQRMPLHLLSPEQAKTFYEAGASVLDLPPHKLKRVEELSVPMRDGSSVAARLYAPAVHSLAALAFVGSIAAFGLVNSGYSSMVAWLAPYYQAQGWTGSQSSNLVAIMALCQAASAFAVQNLAKAGDNIVSSPDLYGGTWNLFANTLKGFGIEVRFVDPADPQAFARATDERTRAYYAETLPNPKLAVFPIAEVAAIGRPLGTRAAAADIDR